MQIFGIGTDIVNTSSFHDTKYREVFRKKIFTDNEVEYCETKTNLENIKERHYAARFAAKEATLKALGRGLSSGMSNIEIGKQHNGAPTITLHGKLAEEFDYLKFMVTISHCPEYATATVIAYFK